MAKAGKEDEFGLLRCAERMLEFSKRYPYDDHKIVQAQTLERMLEKAIRKERGLKVEGKL